MTFERSYSKERANLEHGPPDEESRRGPAHARQLNTAYALIFAIFFSNALQQQVHGNLAIYIYADFSSTGLFATASVLSSIVAAVSKLPIAKMIDVWGRPEGLLLLVTIQAAGLLMAAYCKSIEAYSVAQVLNNIGLFGTNYVLTVCIADTSALKNRGAFFAFSTTPYLLAPVIGPSLAEAIHRYLGYRSSCAIFAIFSLALAMSLAVSMWQSRIKESVKSDLKDKLPESHSALDMLAHYYRELDVTGMILITAALILFLLPLQLAPIYASGWAATEIVLMLFVGITLFPVFAVYERYYASRCFISWDKLMSTTVLSACALSGLLYASFYCWNSWLGTYLMVVFDLDVSESGLIVNIYTIGACLVSMGAGIMIKNTGDFKSIALHAIPLQIFGGLIMILIRQPPYGLWGVVVAQVFLAISGGTLVICEQMAAMASVSDSDVSVVLALESMFSSIGGAVGQTLSGGIYTWMFKKRLLKYLPPDSHERAQDFYEDGINAIREWAAGSQVRLAVSAAWMDVMNIMCIVGVGMLPVGIVLVSLWQRVDVRKERTK